MRAIDADALQLAIVEEGQANKRKKYIIGDIWELTGAEIRDVINSQPTIQPEPHWIPVTERLPEKEGRYLVTNSKIGAWHVDVDFYRPYMGGWMYDQGVTAWMPLPEPAKLEND